MTQDGPRTQTGRPARDHGTRAAILDAAKRLFAEQGFEQVSVRAIATAAGVDPVLIRRFYTDKPTLFATAVADISRFPDMLTEAFAGDPADAARRVTAAYFTAWESPEMRPLLEAVVKSAATSTSAAEILKETLGSRLLQLDKQQSEEDRARAEQLAFAASQLLGFALARYILQLPPLAEMAHEHIVDLLAPNIERALLATT